MNATGDGEARTLFAKQDIGDVDEDGAPEFIDGWGQPIRWMRWAPGMVSNLQPMNADGTRVDHDPLDVYRRDMPPAQGDPLLPATTVYPTDRNFDDIYQENIRGRLERPTNVPERRAFRLVPLIYSIGPDGEAPVLVKATAAAGPLDPYFITEESLQLGPDPSARNAWIDNITNHLVEY
jgi:hypothetical protein